MRTEILYASFEQGGCQYSGKGICRGSVAKYVYEPNPRWHPRYNCESHAPDAEGWVKQDDSAIREDFWHGVDFQDQG